MKKMFFAALILLALSCNDRVKKVEGFLVTYDSTGMETIYHCEKVVTDTATEYIIGANVQTGIVPEMPLYFQEYKFLGPE